MKAALQSILRTGLVRGILFYVHLYIVQDGESSNLSNSL